MICNRHEFEEIYYVGVETSRTTDSYKPKDLPMNQILLSMCIVLFLCLSVQIGMPRLQDLDKKACKAFGILSLEEFCLCAYVNVSYAKSMTRQSSYSDLSRRHLGLN